MAYGQDAPIRIWAWGIFVEIANKAIELYRENIDASVSFEVEELMPQEICDRLSNYSNKNELPNIILVFDQEIKKYLKDFNGIFSIIDDQIDLSVYSSCKIADITHKDHIYGYPLMSEPIALYYNKSALEEYYEHELQDDITWNEFIEIGKALKQQGIYLLPPANYLTRILMQSTGQLYYDIDGYISAEGSREVMELIERLNNDGLLYPDSSLSSDILYNLMANGEIFSIPGAPYRFSAIKQSVQETGEEQEWDLTQLPKSNEFQFDVDFGGCSWLIVNKEEFDDQEAVFDFLMRIFNQENESSRTLIYDKFGNVTKSYQYNPIDGRVETTEYEYNSAHQITKQTLTAGNAQKNSIVNTYSNEFLTYKKEYGESDSLFTQEQYIYTNNAMTSSIDVNNVVTKYEDGTDYAETTIVGETNSPDTNQKKERFPNSRITQTLASGNLKNSYIYSPNGRLQKARFNYSSSVYTSEFLFEYDTFGNLNAFKIGTIPIVTMEYDYKHLNKMTYANGDYFSHTYDAKDRVIAVAENGQEVVSAIYGDNAEDLVTVAHSNGLTYTSKDIGKNGLTGEFCARFSDASRILRAVGYAANGTGNITAVGYFVDDSETPFEKRITTKDSNGLLTKIERINHGAKNTYSYDTLYRMNRKATTYVNGSTIKQYKTEYGYNYFSGHREGTRITKERHYDGSAWKNYSYDYYKNGNIKKISLESDAQSEYSYDAYGRLVRENNYALSRSYKFTYDNGGNIIKKETYLITGGTVADAPTRTDSYNYETITSGYGQNAAWKDQLKSYNGTAIRYDEIGNPLNYLGKVMTWCGRKLTSVDGTTMDYDYNGLRIRKGDKTYYWQSGNLIMERWVKNGAENYIYYYYDESGVCGMNYNGTEYYYRKNILGDVIAIYDSLGNLQCRYVYDAWGNHKVYNASGGEIGAEVLNVGNVNSIRYRGYYLDKEFNLYYLQSRYYDPALGRFISADDVSYLDPESIMGFNLYSYCGNNPIMGIDPTGKWTFSIGFSFYVVLPGAGYSGNIGLSFDSNEMVALQYTYSAPNSKNTRNTAFGLTATAGVTVQITNYDNVDHLNGKFQNVGINSPVIGVDAVHDDSMEFVGISAGVGPTAGGDIHINQTNTRTIGGKFMSFIKWVKGIFGR